ncbi:related to NUM1 - nuclear migration protein [Ustilago trichophora]|uniref:Related to NUM1 - nuclear migration protein n=1 Tax=Ustilago trichophora TaxID=86804 RepID=A0A5C3E7Q7_9BASI|nr:related to NUM1 - nuclear migration protein [Ustilago trichophora]
MDPRGPDSSSEGLFEGNLPPSPSPASRHVYPASPKDMPTSSSLAFRPPPRPGSSMRKGRKSDFNTPAPPPLPTAPMPNYEHRPLADATNFGSHHNRLQDAQLLSSPSRTTVRSAGSVPTSRQSSENAKTVDMTRLVRERLQVLREENETQVNSAGLLGQGLLELRSKIESLMDELAEELSAAEDQSEDSHGDRPGNATIRDLSEKIEAEIEDLERQKQKLFSDITVHSVDVSNGDVAELSMLSLAETPSKATRVADAIRNLTATPGKSPAAQTGSTPRQTDRRSRNAAARQAKADTDLINEIQAGLVQEVRRLQGLLKERDDQRVSLERAHAELEKQLDQYKPRVIQMTETEDALKQENWDLNVSKQNLEEQLSEIKSALKKAELDNVRLNKDVIKARETVDSQRLQIDGHVAEIERLNKSRETEIALARRERAGMQRDVSDLQSELQKFRQQQLNDRGGVSRSVSNSFMSDVTNDDASGDADALAARLRAASGEAPRSPGDSIYSADGAILSPLGNRLGRDKETQDLRAKLALAQRKAGKDAAEKRRVREKNAELTKLLVKAGVKVPQGLDDDAETSEDEELHWLDDNDPHSPSAKRLSQIRVSRPTSIRPRLGRKMGMISSNSTDSIIEYAEFEDDSHIGTPAGPDDASPSRASLDGMDPAFADYSRPDAGNASIDSIARKGHRSRLSIGSSPLARNAQLPQETNEQESHSQQRILPKSGRRSGATVRPASTVFEPSALGNELGGLAAELEQHAPEEVREMFDNSMQTDEMPDLVGPALAKRDEQHKAEIATIRTEHATAIEAIHAEHATKLSTLQGQHAEAIDTLKQSHEKEINELNAAHEKSLAEKDEGHSALIESALAERTKLHEAALSEARSRHSRALAEQVAASSAALAAAVASHKTSSEDLERKVKDEKERKEASHAFALAQKDRQHKESLDTLQASHAEALDRLRDEHKQLLAIREKALEEADAQLVEHEKATKALAESHTSEIAALQQKHQEAIAEREKQIKELEASHASAVADLQARHQQELAKHQESNKELAAAHENELASLHDGHRQVLTKHEISTKELVASHASALASLQDNHREVLNKHETANKELSASHAAAVAALQDGHREALAGRDAQLDSSKKELDARTQELEARNQELRVAKSEIAELQKSIATLRAETEELKQQLAELQKTHTAAERELSETKSNLDMVNDKVRRQEETARELSRQREAEATAAAAAVAARSEALTATEAQKEQLEAAHAVAVAQKERQHQDAVKELEDRHATAVAQIRSEHKQALESRDQTVQTHQQLVADRERELEEKRSELQKAQAQVQALEQQLVSERERAAEQQRTEVAKVQTQVQTLEAQLVSQREEALEDQRNEVEKVQAQIKTLEQQLVDQRAKALEEQGEEVQKVQAQVQLLEKQLASERERALKDQSSEVQKVQAQVQSLEQQLASERERALEQQRSEVEKVQIQVVALEQQLAKMRTHADSAQQSRSSAEINLKEAQNAHSALQKQHDEVKATVASLQSKVRYLESSIAAQRSSTEQNRLASDKELQTIQSALNTAQKKVREQEATIAKAEAAAAAALAAAAAAEAQLLVRNDVVTDTENEADDFKDAVEATDVPATNVDTDVATPKVPTVELKENSCQTDDDAWKLYQQQQRKVSAASVSSAVQTDVPSSPLQPTSESIAAQNNLVILGGLKSSSRARDSVGTFGGDRASSPANMLYSADAISSQNQSRRPSADSTWSRHTDRYASEAIPPVPPLPDKTKAPIMSMPPPPSMPPPSVKRNVLATAPGQAPPRPTSPPPADLLSRAQQRHLQVPAGSSEQPRSVSRASGRSGPPPSAYPSSSRARQQSSGTGSMRSRTYSNDSANPQPLDGSIYTNLASGRKSIGSRKSATRRPAAGPRQSSAASFVSDVTSEVSRRLSMMSSRASDADGGDETFVVRGQGAGGKGHGQRGLSEFGADATDPAIIHAITQTMIGEYMFKYTRKSMGRGGHSDKRHRRYFWLHPYTKMLYWTISDPGGAKVSEGTSKSASIESVRVVEDSNPNPPGLHPESIIITTASREVKISAPNRERHEAWLAALEYLVHRPTIQDATVIASNAAPELVSDAENDPTLITRSVGRRAKPRASAATLGAASVTGSRRLSAQRSFLSRRSSDHGLRTESTPRRRGGSIGAQSVLYPSLGKRPDVAAKAWLQQHEHDRELSISMSPSHSLRGGAVYSPSVGDAGEDSYDLLDLTATQSPIRRALANDDPRLKTAEQMLEEDEPEDWDGLTNVRACCDGKHDVGSLAHHHHHGGNSASGSRKSSRLHRRESSGGSRFSSIGLKSKLDAAVRAAEEREQAGPVPRIPASLLPSGGTGMGKMALERESLDSNASSSFAHVFGSSSTDRPASSAGGPSYGERIQQIRKARQSAGSTGAGGSAR